MAYECGLPDDIIENIFARMSAKPLLRLKSLSKHWNRLISDPRFMKLRSHRMILLPTLPLQAIDNTDIACEMVKLHFPYGRSKDKYVNIVGTFNGIVFLVIEKINSPDEMMLYNPFTGAVKIVPHLPLRSDNFFTHTYTYGFCYGASPDDFKIIRIGTDIVCCDVFSLENGSWCTTSGWSGGDGIVDKAGTFVNGFLYWVAYTIRALILALDVKEMVFSEIEIPHEYMLGHLGTFKGHLCMFCSHNIDEYQIKVMNEHGFGNPWSTVCSFNVSSVSRYCETFKSMCILNDRKCVMLKRPNHVIIHDMMNHSYKEVSILKRLGKIHRLNFIEYVESLISPFDLGSIYQPLS